MNIPPHVSFPRKKITMKSHNLGKTVHDVEVVNVKSFST